MSAQTEPTPYAEINAVLYRLLEGVQAALGERFIGLYLHGSLACGDFRLQSSDVDFLVATQGELDDEALAALAAMHARLTESGSRWARKIEGSYIPLRALRRHDPANARFPALRVDGSFSIDGHGSEWVIQRHILREWGIVLAGPDLKTWIDPVSGEDLRQAVRDSLNGWWTKQLCDPVRLRSREYQAYAILTMCRSLYVLEQAKVVSKPEAARRAMERLGDGWARLIEQALAWPEGEQPDRLEETLDLICYTREKARDVI